MKKLLTTLVILSSLLYACTLGNDKIMLPNVSGKTGEVLIIIEDNFWDGIAGDTLRNILMRDHPALPQPEPLFNVIHLKNKAFGKLFSNHRNIIRTTISKNVTEASIKVSTDKWAKPQTIIDIEAPSEHEFVEIVGRNREKIENILTEAEMSRLFTYYKQYQELALRTKMKEKYDIDIYAPKGFAMYAEQDNFAWIHHETQLLHQGIWVYTLPYTDTALLSRNNLVKIRDKVVKKYIPGPTENAYMTTEQGVEVDYRAYMSADNVYTVEMRGLWRMVNDFMGGPFVSYTTVDEKNNRLIIAEGFVYAGKQDKRNFLWQVECIVRKVKSAGK